MKAMTIVLLFVSLFAMVLPARASKDIEKAHATTHTIFMETVLTSGKCSSAAIGPHALLTASHCELPTDYMFVDGALTFIRGVLRDGQDHTIYLLDTTFENYATFSSTPFAQGDEVFIFGNPGKDLDLFRIGYVSGFTTIGDSKETVDAKQVYYDMRGFHGDSGAAVFNMKGEIVGVISSGEVQHQTGIGGDWPFVMMSGFLLSFNRAQFDLSQAFVPPARTTNSADALKSLKENHE